MSPAPELELHWEVAVRHIRLKQDENSIRQGMLDFRSALQLTDKGGIELVAEPDGLTALIVYKL